jgi:hypothetical protein
MSTAVVGGVALAAYGHARLTLDLDVVTNAAARDPVVSVMQAAGYATLYRSLERWDELERHL